jgi:hypothetical protein
MTDNFTFEEKKIQGYNRFGEDKTVPLLTRLVLKSGFAQDEKQAEKILMIIAGIIIVVAVGLMIWAYQPIAIKTINIKS